MAAGPYASLASADGGPDASSAGAEGTGLWFVELPSAPTADGTSPADLRAERAAFRADARDAGLRYRERFAFDRLWNGVSVELRDPSVDVLARLSSVKRVFPVVEVSHALTEPVADPHLATALAMTGADVAQHDLGLSGKGIRVAVMDTGVDYHHPDLGGCFGPGCRVEAGHDFVGDTFNADSTSPSYNPVPVPDPDPDDCGGHGTHVAGIIGSRGEVTGVAPAVTLGSYRVFGCGGSTTADIMIAAMERALDDRMDVLNMSIGSAYQWPQYPTAEAADRLARKGVAVVASIGNSGENGTFSASAPGVGSKVIGVASYDNSHLQLPLFTATPDDRAFGYQPASGAPEPPTSGAPPLTRTGTQTSTGDACAALPAGSLAGKVALIRRGSCGFHAKALNAQDAGAIGVVLYNNVPGRFSATVAGPSSITIPVVSITETDGTLLDERIAGGDVSMTWTDERMAVPNATGNTISSFSSYGPTPELDLKPDIGAPGGLIRAPYPLERGAYATLGGTSMAAPHVAGAIALLLEAKPRTPASAIRSILQNTADPKPWWGQPAGSHTDNVHRQGAGMLDIPQAVGATTRIGPSSLSLGESEAGPVTRTLTIENASGTDRTYTLGNTPSLATTGTFVPAFSAAPSSVDFASGGDRVTTVTVPAGGVTTVDATITAPGNVDKALYGGYLVVQDTEDPSEIYRVPYAGFTGDYQALPVLTGGYPRLVRASGASGSGATFTLAGDDVPFLRVHLDHQVRRLRITVLDAVTGRNWGRALDQSYLGRSSTSNGYFDVPWSGSTMIGNKDRTVPDGRYVLRLTAVKALGDESAGDAETWTSPAFDIDRP